MILPGLSGSYILIMMGNYMLIVTAVSDMEFSILIPLALGCVIGLLAFSHILSWIFKHFREVTIALLTGFILGSLKIIWPWKIPVLSSAFMKKDGEIEYLKFDLFFPDSFGQETIIVIGMILLGILSIAMIEKMGVKGNVQKN
jgi:putative membrane protein